MSGEEKVAESNSAPAKVGWFTRVWTTFYLVLMMFVMTGVSIWLGQDLINYVDRHWSVPLLKPLVTAKNAPHVQSKLEYGFVIEVFPNALGSSGDELYLLRRKLTFSGMASAGDRGVVANILSVNSQTGESHWVFKGSDRAILETQPVYGLPSDDPNASVMMPLKGIAMIVAEQDTDKDGEVGAGDRVTLCIYRLDGKAPEKLLTADRIKLVQGTVRSRVFYQNGSNSFLAAYSMPEFRLLQKAPVADMPKLASQSASEFYPDD